MRKKSGRERYGINTYSPHLNQCNLGIDQTKLIFTERNSKQNCFKTEIQIAMQVDRTAQPVDIPETSIFLLGPKINT